MLLTLKEVCEELRLTEAIIYRMIKNKEIPIVRIGGKNLFKKEDIDDFIESKRIKKD